MNFLEPWGLLGLAALLPIVALYFLKLKREERVVPSTLLWKKVIQDMHVNAPFQRLRYSLLLLLQLLLVALLAYALARPYLATSATEGQRLILLVDTSASMGTKDAGPGGRLTRLEAAVQKASAKIDDLGANAELRLVAFDEEVIPFGGFTQDRAAIKDQLKALKPRHLRTHAQPAFEVAMTLAQEHQNAQVLVLSDGCFGALDLVRVLGIKDPNVNIENVGASEFANRFQFVSFGSTDSDNVAITGINAKSRLVMAKDEKGDRVQAIETQVFVLVENFSPKDQDVILSLSTAAQTFPPKVIKLKGRARNLAGLQDDTESGQTVEASRSNEVFMLPLDTAGVVTARIQAPQDAFELDNEARVVVGGAEGTRVLFVSDGNYFIKKVLVSMQGYQATEMTPVEFEKDWKARGPLAVKDYDCVIFERWAPETWEDGGAIFIAKLPPIPGFTLDEKTPELKGPPIVDWNETHPVMRYVNFGNVAIRTAQHWNVPKAADVLVETDAGPLIAALETDRMHVVGLTFEIFESDLPLRQSMPLFLRNAIAWAGEASSRSAVRTGEPLVIPPLTEPVAATLVRPNGAREPVEVQTDAKTYVRNIQDVGLYTLTDLPGGRDADRLFAVNLTDPDESDNAVREKIEAGVAQVEATPQAIEAKREIWRWLAITAVVLLLAEWWVYHRRIGL